MKNRYLLVALALVVFVNGIILMGVAGNRRGEPEATLILTERELGYPAYYQKEENSGISLQLDWNRYRSEHLWFGPQKLEDLGFDVEAITLNNQDPSHYQRQVPKRGFVVLEYAGEAWRKYQTEKEAEIAELERKTPADAKEAEKLASQIARISGDLTWRSRLFAVDVGPDPDALRKRYPARNRFVVVAAKVRAGYGYSDRQKVHGRVVQLLVERIHVPLSLQAPLADLPPSNYPSFYDSSPEEVRKWKSRYDVTVSWGSRFEPWVEAVKLTPVGGQ